MFGFETVVAGKELSVSPAALRPRQRPRLALAELLALPVAVR